MTHDSVTNVEKIYTMDNLIVIIGPTAIGKTSLSLALAKHFDCEIVSADSRQFYKEMCIGTAVPNKDELQQATHHCIQHKSIHELYTVGDFEKEALTILPSLFQKKNHAILVGGSGLYVDAVTKGLDNFPDVDSSIRKKLQKQFEHQGVESLQQQLKKLDLDYYNKVDLQNTQRVMRALEICIGTDKPFSSFLSKTTKKRAFNSIKIGITADRQIIYDRINQRVDIMLEEGLLEEAKQLYQHKNLNALNTVGYKELFNFFDEKWDLDFAISEIKKNTRRFAKRQLTWYRKDEEVKWFDYKEDLDQVVAYIKKKSL